MKRNADYQQGRADGLAEARDIMLALEADVAGKLERASPSATKRARLVRRQAYKNGATRIATRLRKVRTASPVESVIKRLGL